MSKYYVVEYELWPTYEPDEGDLGEHMSRSTYEVSSEVAAINAALYYVRGRKSQFEMAWINNVFGPFEEENKAREKQYE